MFATLFTDGASRGNPGPAGAGVLIKKGDQIVDELRVFLGTKTNNEAEYMAVILGLECAHMHKFKYIKVYSDSQLLVKQLQGTYKVKAPTLQPLFAKAKEILSGFDSVEFLWIPREQNTRADALANEAIDEQNRQSSHKTL